MLLISLPVAGSQVAVECSWVSTDSGRTQLILDTSSAVPHQIFTLDGPDRVVIDIVDARLVGELPAARVDDPILVGARGGVRGERDLRLVLDLKRPVRVKSFAALPEGRPGHRLVVELISGTDELPLMRGPQFKRMSGRESPAPPRPSRARMAIVAIDAGHGGEDPGAIGPGGTREKDATLAIALKLARLIEKEPGIGAVMIRDGDDYIALRQRILKARASKADLFVSIHADAYNNPEAHGSSVYTLSQVGASSEAASWLASRENSADLIGGVDLSASDELLATVLLDMTQNATIEHSTEAASAVLGYLRHVGAVHKTDVQRAGFVVLKSPDIPSILVETAFISNQAEERRLTSNAHQQRVAQAILAGIRAYFKKYPPQGFLTADVDEDGGRNNNPAKAFGRSPRPSTSGSREYVISQGDTLSGIAKRHSVSINSLKAENGLSDNDLIRAGQVLSIPSDS
nr:N-acetylmuramoyl-L-alanine amidase [Thiocystis violacea]